MEFDGVDHAIAVVKLDHMGARDKEKSPRRIWISCRFPERILQNRRTAVLVERKKARRRGRSLDRTGGHLSDVDSCHFLYGSAHRLFQGVIKFPTYGIIGRAHPGR